MATLFGHISYEMLDSLGVTVSMPIYVNIDDSQTIATAMNNVNALALDTDDITDAQITNMKLVIEKLPSGVKSAPVAHSENEKTGLFNFSQTASPYKYGVDVPAISDNVIVNGKIDLTNTDVQAFKNALITAGAALTVVSTAIKSLVALVDALITFRKHRKAESRRSFEVA